MGLFRAIIEVQIDGQWHRVSISDIRIYKEIANKKPIRFVGIENIRILEN